MLSQAETARLLDRCLDEESPELAMEEVLSAYVAWKLIRGQSCPLVLVKLRYMATYLRVTDRRQVLDTISQVFMVTGTELSFGGGLVGACPVSTPIGKEVWNALRRKLGTSAYAFKTDPEYGGPITLHQLRSIDDPRNPVRQMHEHASPDVTARGSSTMTGNALDSLARTLSTVDSTSSTGTENSTRRGLFSRLRPSSSRTSQRDSVAWSERPRWIRTWFLTRPHLAGQSNMLQMLVPDYRSLVPTYTSFRGTLPLYVSDRSRSSA